MKSTHKFYQLSVINILLIVFQIGFSLCAIALIFYISLGVLEMFIDESAIPNDFPVMFSLDHIGTVNLPDQSGQTNFSMKRGMGVMIIEELPQVFVTLYRLIYILGLSCFLWSLKFTIDILKAVKQGNFLIKENARRLQSIALLGIGMYFLGSLGTLVSSSYLSDKLHFPGLEFKMNAYVFFDVETLIYSLFLLVISEAFRIGALLKEEADLTI